MIATIHGVIQHIGSGSLVVSVGGVGLRVFVPRTVLENTGGVGRTIRLFTHLLVRETELALYGFESEEDLAIFELLLGVMHQSSPPLESIHLICSSSSTSVPRAGVL